MKLHREVHDLIIWEKLEVEEYVGEVGIKSNISYSQNTM